MSKLTFGKLISKLQLSKSPEEREGILSKCIQVIQNMEISHFVHHCSSVTCTCTKLINVLFFPELLSNMAQLHAFSCHQLGK